VVPLATPRAPVAEFSHTTRVTTDGAVPVMLMLDCVVVKDVPVVGVQIDTVGAAAQPVPPVDGGGVGDVGVGDVGGGDVGGGVVVVPEPELERVTSSLSVNGLPAPSYAVMSITFVPACRGMLAIVQLVVPLATPLTPLGEFSHTTRVMAGDAVPVRVMLDCVVEKDVPVVGVQIDTVAVGQPVGVVGVVVVPPVLLLVDDVVIVHVNVCLALNVPSDAITVTM